MNWFYNLALHLTAHILGILAWFNPKINRFVSGRKNVFEELRASLVPGRQVFWVHTASLGEFEQGLPLIQRLKRSYPGHQVLVTFFSPSGYEVKKGSGEADCFAYLPLDTKKNVREFLDLVHPEIALFVKYEVWPNYFHELNARGIPLLLVSARFKKEQAFFKWYGGVMRKALSCTTHFFVQDESSVDLLGSVGLENASVSGDTRFDRVAEILNRDNTLDFMESFIQDELCLVGGSTWPEDEEILVPYINSCRGDVKFVLAPHDIKEEHIRKLSASIEKEVILYSECRGDELEKARVLIIDTIGLLTKIYSYAHIAYVGGGFATGLHNTLEPAVFGIPVIIGPQYRGFKEAVDMVERKGTLVVDGYEKFETLADQLVSDPEFRKHTGQLNAVYVKQKQGATDQIMSYIQEIIKAKGAI